ncbi:MAG: hypothetical protein KatS3mg118_2336 [Paracoccaceae bacterium]|nr:MAG: hypothetical protein KatS3mg118_2336 [Paracoccaceae bacterium]
MTAPARDLAVMRAAYEARIAALAAERDDARGTVSALHRRVEEATRQLALTQAELVTALEAERARSLTLAAVRRNLAEAVRARDLAEREREALALRLAALEGDLSRRAGSENDLSQTLGAVSAALADSIRRREAAEARLSELNAEIAALEERNRIDAQRMERAIGADRGGGAVQPGPDADRAGGNRLRRGGAAGQPAREPFPARAVRCWCSPRPRPRTRPTRSWAAWPR